MMKSNDKSADSKSKECVVGGAPDVDMKAALITMLYGLGHSDKDSEKTAGS